MNQHDFNKILEKYLNGDCTAEQEELIREWQKNILKNSHPSLREDEKARTQRRLWNKIASQTIASKTIREKSGYRKTLLFSSMVTFALLSIFLFFFLFKPAEKPEHVLVQHLNQPGDIQVKNNSDTPREITLEDGTIVSLKTKSSISYPEHFDDKSRNIFLIGEAVFNIKRNPSVPFLVHTGELVTEVLGTIFTIKSYEDSNAIEVSVVSGKVSVYEANPNFSNKRNGVILTPNQKIIFNKTSKNLTSSIVENPQAIVPIATKIEFIFEETPIEQVLEKLSHAYGLEIVVKNHDLYKCVLNADLNDLSLATQLDLICKSVNANYEQRGTGIFIDGEGCKTSTEMNH